MARPPPFSFSSSSSLPNFACPDSSEPQVIIDCDSSYEELVVRQNVPSGRRDGLSGTPDPPSSAAVHDHLPRDVTRPVARPASSCSSSSSSSFSQASTSRYLPSPSGEDDGEHEDDETTTSSSSAPDSDTSAVRRSDRLARQPKPQYTLSSTSSNLSIFFGFKSSVAGAGTALAHKTSTKRRRVGRKRKLPAVLTPKDAQIDENIDPRKAEHPPPDQPFLFLWGSSQKDVRPEPDWLPRVGTNKNAKGETVEWLRKACYCIGSLISTKRFEDFFEWAWENRCAGRRKDRSGDSEESHLDPPGRSKDETDKEAFRRWWFTHGLPGQSSHIKEFDLDCFHHLSKSTYIGLAGPGVPTTSDGANTLQGCGPSSTCGPMSSPLHISFEIDQLRSRLNTTRGVPRRSGGGLSVPVAWADLVKRRSKNAADYSQVSRAFRIQVLRALRGEQNFVRVEAVPQGHFLHKMETEKSPAVKKARQTIQKHFRAVAEIGSLPFLPPFTVIGPPYGGILRPDEEIRLMMNIDDPPRGLTGRVRECYSFQVEADYLRNWGPCNSRNASFSPPPHDVFGEGDILVVDDDPLTVSSSDEPDTESAVKRRRDREGREVTSGGRRRQETYEEGKSDEEFEKRTDGARSVGEDLQDVIRDVEGEGESPRALGRRSKASSGYLDMAADKQTQQLERLSQDFANDQVDIRESLANAYARLSYSDGASLDALEAQSELAMLNDSHGQPDLRPNCVVVPVLVHGVPMLVAVTISPVQQGEELLIDYGDHYWENIVKDDTTEHGAAREAFSLLTKVFAYTAARQERVNELLRNQERYRSDIEALQRHQSDWRHVEIADRRSLEDFLSSQESTDLESLEKFLNSQKSSLESDATRALLGAAIRHIREQKKSREKEGEEERTSSCVNQDNGHVQTHPDVLTTDSNDQTASSLAGGLAGDSKRSSEKRDLKTAPSVRSKPMGVNGTTGDRTAPTGTTTTQQRQHQQGEGREEEDGSRGECSPEKLQELRTFFENFYASQLQELKEKQKRVERELDGERALKRKMVDRLRSEIDWARSEVAYYRQCVEDAKKLVARGRLQQELTSTYYDKRNRVCPYSRVTETMGIHGLSAHQEGENANAHEKDCKAIRYLRQMKLLEENIGMCPDCHMPYVKTPGVKKSDIHNRFTCRARHEGFMEFLCLGVEHEQNTCKQVALFFTMLQNDAVVCTFLFSVFCSLSRGFYRWKENFLKRGRRFRVGPSSHSSAGQITNGGPQVTIKSQLTGTCSLTSSSSSSSSLLTTTTAVVPSGVSEDVVVKGEIEEREEGECTEANTNIDGSTQGEEEGGDDHGYPGVYVVGGERRTGGGEEEEGSQQVASDASTQRSRRRKRKEEEGVSKREEGREDELEEGGDLIDEVQDIEEIHEDDAVGIDLDFYDADDETGNEQQGIDMWLTWLVSRHPLREELPGANVQEQKRAFPSLIGNLKLLIKALHVMVVNIPLGRDWLPPKWNRDNWLRSFVNNLHDLYERFQIGLALSPADGGTFVMEYYRCREKILEFERERKKHFNVGTFRSYIRERRELEDRRRDLLSQLTSPSSSFRSEELQHVQLRIAALTTEIEKLAQYDTRAWCSRLKMYCDDCYDEYLRYNRMSRVQDGRWNLFKYFSYVAKGNSWERLLDRVKYWSSSDIQGTGSVIGVNRALRAIADQPEAKARDGTEFFDAALEEWRELRAVVDVGIARDRELRNDETDKLRRKVAQLEQELQQCHSVLKAVDEEYSACPHLERPKAWELVHALYDGSLAHLERVAGVGRGLRGREDRWDTGLDIVDVDRLGGERRRGSFASRTSATVSGQGCSSLQGPETRGGPANQQASPLALMRALPDADLYHGGWVNSSSSSDPALGGRPEEMKREEGGGKVAVKEPLEGKVQVQQDLCAVKESQKQLDPKLQPTPLYQLYPSLCGDRIVQERSDMRRLQAFKDFPDPVSRKYIRMEDTILIDPPINLQESGTTGTSSSDKRWACFTIDLVCRISALWRPSGLCGPDRAKGGGGSFAGKKGGGGKGGYNTMSNAKVKGSNSGKLFLAGGGEIFDPILSCTPAAGLRKGEPPRPWKKAPTRLASPGASCWSGGGGGRPGSFYEGDVRCFPILCLKYVVDEKFTIQRVIVGCGAGPSDFRPFFPLPRPSPTKEEKDRLFHRITIKAEYLGEFPDDGAPILLTPFLDGDSIRPRAGEQGPVEVTEPGKVVFLSRIRNVHSVQGQYNESLIQTPNEGFYLHYLQIFSYAFDPDQLPPVTAYLKHPSFSYRQPALIKRPKIDVELLGISEQPGSLPGSADLSLRQESERYGDSPTLVNGTSEALPDVNQNGGSSSSASSREGRGDCNRARASSPGARGAGESFSHLQPCSSSNSSSVSPPCSPERTNASQEGYDKCETLSAGTPCQRLRPSLAQDGKRAEECGRSSSPPRSFSSFHTPRTSPLSPTAPSDSSQTAFDDVRMHRQDSRTFRDSAASQWNESGSYQRPLHLTTNQVKLEREDRGGSPTASSNRRTPGNSFPEQPRDQYEHPSNKEACTRRSSSSFVGKAEPRDGLYRNPYSGHSPFKDNARPGADSPSYGRPSPQGTWQARSEGWQPPRWSERDGQYHSRYGREAVDSLPRGREDTYDVPRRGDAGSPRRQGDGGIGQWAGGSPIVKEEFRGRHQHHHNRDWRP